METLIVLVNLSTPQYNNLCLVLLADAAFAKHPFLIHSLHQNKTNN